MPACGGGATGEPTTPGGEEKKDEGSGDPVADLKATSDGLQKEIDALFEPIKNADAVITAVADIPKEIKAAKSKADPKKLMAEASKLVDSGEFNLEGTGLEGELKTKVTERFEKLKALVVSIKTLPEKTAALPGKIGDAAKKVATAGPAAIGKAKAKAMAPFGVSADDKKKAEEDIKTIEGIVKSFPEKAEGWKKDVTDIPTKAKDIPTKMKAAFKA
ncbi:Hypothetical protein A7982_09278 [Minicystis rosea]|nr:Hypothetical protein A7982_09278 [Minicystis rosea]